jgi:hypothetical protein
MKFLFLILFLAGCNDAELRCEPPYFSGQVYDLYIGKHGTSFTTKDGKRHNYSPGIKCEAVVDY